MMHSLKNNGTLALRLHRWLAQVVTRPIVVPLCLLVIMLVGVLLRTYKLGEWSFWGDEMFTVSGKEDGFNYTIFRQAISLVLIQKFVAVAGLNEWNTRIVPALVGVITIPILFYIVWKFFDIPTALVAALLLAISPWHLYWSQNARFYTALLLFYSLALFFFYLGTERDNVWYLLTCLIFLGLAVKERLLALFFLPVILIYLLLLILLSFEKPKGWNYRNLAIFILPGLLGSLVFAGPYLLNLPAWMSGFGFANNSPVWLAGGFAYYVGLPVICLGGAGGFYLVAKKNRAGLLLFVSAIVPLLLLMIVSPFHYTANRYAFMSLTSWLALAAVAVVMLVRNTIGPSKLLAVATLFVLLVNFLSEDSLYFLYQNGNRDNWKAAFAYIHEHQQPQDLLASNNPTIANYYLPTSQTLAFSQINIQEIESCDQRIWFVADMVDPVKFPELHTWITQNARLVSIHDVSFHARNFSMRVYLYDPINAPGEGTFKNEK